MSSLTNGVGSHTARESGRIAVCVSERLTLRSRAANLCLRCMGSPRWDALPGFAVGLALVLTALASSSSAQTPPDRHVLARHTAGAWHVVVTAPRLGAGLEGALLEATRGSHRSVVPLDTSHTGRLARAIDALVYQREADRLLVLTDQTHDRPGLIIVDLRRGEVVETVVGRHMTRSSDARFVAFEEYYPRHTTTWPWNETVYAVVDVAAPAGSMRRTCPFADDRCRGHAVYLPDRRQVCTERAALTGSPCLDPHRAPQHERRSPFIWVDDRTLAFITLDHARDLVAVVTARFGEHSVAPDVSAVPCETQRLASDGRCPSPREAWHVDAIRPDDDGQRVWVHFRERLPEVPSGWLGLSATP